MTKPSTRKKVREFKAKLPEGAIEKVAQKLGVSRQTVSKHLNKYNLTHPVMSELAHLAELETRKAIEVKNKIESLN